MSILVGQETLLAQTKRLDADSYAWQVTTGTVPTGQYAKTEQEAIIEAEKVVMDYLRKTSKTWKKAA